MSFKSALFTLSLVALVPVVGLAATADSAASTTSAPAKSGWAAHRGGQDSLMLFLHSAHLTPDQQAQVKTILHDSRVAMKPVSDERRQVHEQIADLLMKPGSVDSAQLATLVQKDETLGKQLSEQHLQTAVTVRNLLTPDQLAKVAQTRAQMKTLHSQMQNLIQQP
jgi:Spy/CpxP family protein refolding chaperone